MKRSVFSKSWIIAALAVVIGLSLISCDTGSTHARMPTPEPTLLQTERLEVVTFGSDAFDAPGRSVARFTANNDNFELVESGRSHDEGTWYFLYYMGFINSAPIAFREAVHFTGVTPVTVSFTQTEQTSEMVSHALSQSFSETVSRTGTVGASVSVSASGGFAPFASVEVSASASVSMAISRGQTWSSSDTFTVANTRIRGLSQTLSATIGNNNEPAGNYRWSLMGTTDVFLMVRVDSNTHQVIDAEVIHAVREATLAWRLEFSPDIGFSRTGGGGDFMIGTEDFVFTAADRPERRFDSSPCPGECGCDGEGACGRPMCTCVSEPIAHLNFTTGRFVGDAAGGGTGTRVSGGDNNIGSENNRATDWNFRVTGMELVQPRGDGTYGAVQVTVEYNVHEVWSNFTHLRITRTHTFDFGTRRVESLVQGTTEGAQSGRIMHQNHGWNRIRDSPGGTNPFGSPQSDTTAHRTWPNIYTVPHHGSPNAAQLENMNAVHTQWNSGVIRGLTLRIDGTGGNDLPNIGYNAIIAVSVRYRR